MMSHDGSPDDGSSPRSKAHLDSHQGSPETKVTAFSPEDMASTTTPNGLGTKTVAPPVFSLDLAHYQLPSYLQSPMSVAQASSTVDAAQLLTADHAHDPFITTSKATQSGAVAQEQKLSPTASTFTPTGSTFTPMTASNSSPWSVRAGLSGSSSSKNTSNGIDFLNATSVPDFDRSPGAPAAAVADTPSPFSSTPALGATGASKLTRALVIQSIPNGITASTLQEYFHVSGPALSTEAC